MKFFVLFVLISQFFIGTALAQSTLNSAPNCANAFVQNPLLWPPNHKFQSFTIQGIADDDDQLSIEVQCIHQDEPLNGQGDGNTSPDAVIQSNGQFEVRSERQGGGNGRVYHVDFKATDSFGASCESSLQVQVPKSKKNLSAINDGRHVDATGRNVLCDGVIANQSPAFTAVPAQSTHALEDYAEPLKAIDPEQQTLSFSLLKGPQGMAIQGDTLVWSPTQDDIGPHHIKVRVQDSRGALNLLIFMLEVLPPLNTAPEMTSTPVVTVDEGASYTYAVSAIDAENDALTYSLISGPEAMVFDGTTLVWSPGYDDAGAYAVIIEVSDGQLSVQQSFSIQVDNVNRAPAFVSQPTTDLIVLGDTFLYSPQTADADGDTVTLVLENATAGVELLEQQVRWTPTQADDVLRERFILVASDGQGGEARQSVALRVAPPPNTAPVILSQPNTQLSESDLYQYTIVATDADDDALEYRLIQGPDAMVISGSTLLWSPSFEDEGVYPIVIEVFDGSLGVQQSFSLDVANTNRAPTFLTTPSITSIQRGSPFQYTPETIDLDGDEVAISLVQGAPGFALNGGTLIGSNYLPDLQNAHLILEARDSLGASTQQLINLVIEDLPFYCFVANATANYEDCGALVIVSTPQDSVQFETPFEYQVQISSELEGAVQYTLLDAPIGLDISLLSGLVQFIPQESQIGTHDVLIQATNVETGHYGLQYFELEVTGRPNQTPILNGVNNLVLLTQKDLKQVLSWTGTDPDNDLLSWSVSGLPNGLTFDQNAFTLQGDLEVNQEGVYPLIVVLEDEFGAAATQEITLEVIRFDAQYEYWTVFEDVSWSIQGIQPYDAPTITLYSESAAIILIEIEAFNIKSTVEIKPFTFEKIPLPVEIMAPSGAENLGVVLPPISVKISSDREISVISGNFAPSASDSSNTLEKRHLGTQYLTNTGVPNDQEIENAPTDDSIYEANVFIVATEDDTTVTITPAIRGTIAQQPDVNFTLSAGQVYKVRAFNFSMNGGHINADKPIAVFTLGQCVSIWGGACDPIYEQLLPKKLLDVEYVITPTRYKTSGDPISISSTEDGNIVQYMGQSIVLDKNETKAIYIDEPTLIFSTYPIAIHQWITGRNGDYTLDYNTQSFYQDDSLYRNGIITGSESALFQAHGKNFWATEHLVSTLGHDIQFELVDIVIPMASVSSLRMNETIPEAILTTLIPGSEYAWVTLELRPGVYRLTADEPFSVKSFGLGFSETYVHQSMKVADKRASFVDQTDIRLGGALSESLCIDLQMNTDTGAPFDYQISVLNTTSRTQNTLTTDGNGLAQHCVSASEIDTQTFLYFGRSIDGVKKVTRVWSENNTASKFEMSVYSDDSYRVYREDDFVYQLKAYSTLENDDFTYSLDGIYANYVSLTSNGLLRVNNVDNRVNSFRTNYFRSAPIRVRVENTTGEIKEIVVTPKLVYNRSTVELLDINFNVPKPILMGKSDTLLFSSKTPKDEFDWSFFKTSSYLQFTHIFKNVNKTEVEIKPTDWTGSKRSYVQVDFIHDAVGLTYHDYFGISRLENTPPNTFPVLDPISVPQLRVGDQIKVLLSAFDADSDTIYFDVDPRSFGRGFIQGKSDVQYYNSYTQEIETGSLSSLDTLYIDTKNKLPGFQGLLVSAYDARFGNGRDNQIVPAYLTTTTNVLPKITSMPATETLVGESYAYQIILEDTDDTAFTYKLENAPIGMRVGEAGLVSWTPAASQLGHHDVTVRVVDAQFGFDLQSYRLFVTDGQSYGPRFTTPAPENAIFNSIYTYAIQAVDPDGGEVTYALLAGPDGMNLSSTGVLNWVPQKVHPRLNTVSLQVTDDEGDTAIQNFTIRILDYDGTNNPPSITSTPPQRFSLSDGFNYQVIAIDPDTNQTLQYSLALAPEGMSVTDNGLVSWLPAQANDGDYVDVVIQVTDTEGGIDSQSFRLTYEFTTNAAPIIRGEAVTIAQVNQEYRYFIDALDPEGEALTYTLLDAPVGMTVSSTGLMLWTPTQEQIGLAFVQFEVKDETGAAVTQSFGINVSDETGNSAPTITSTPPNQMMQGNTLAYQIIADDADNDPLSYRLVSGAGQVSSTGLYEVSAGFDETSLEAVIAVSDGELETTQNIQVVIEPVVNPTIQFSLTPAILTVGNSAQVVVRFGEHYAGPQFVPDHQVTLNGAPVALTTGLLVDEPGLASIGEVSPSLAGVYSIGYAVTFANGDVQAGQVDLVVQSLEQAADAPQISWITPEDEITITAPVSLQASIVADDLASYRLAYRTANQSDSPWVNLAQGNSSFTGKLAVFDTSLLRNGVYELLLEAVNTAGRSSTLVRRITVEGELKAGFFSFTIEDMQRTLTGVPIQVQRTYDSRDKNRRSDFGYGWSLDYQNVTVEETRVPGSFWAMRETRSGPFNLIQNFCIEPIGEPKVVVTLPNGDQERFRVQASPRCNQFTPITRVELEFVPEDDTRSSLRWARPQLVDLINGNLFFDLSDATQANVADPNQYILTTEVGYEFHLQQGVGLEKMIDPNGNSLTYSDAGIAHSDGPRIDFNRNAQGLITSIQDSSGASLSYIYDDQLQLVEVIDQNNHSTTFAYQSDRLLTDIFDPLGRKLVQNIYNENGRLIAQEDNDGDRRSFNHDIEGRQSVVTDRLGRTSVSIYNDRGDVTASVDAYGQTTLYSVDAVGNVLSMTDPLNRVTRFEYDSKSRMIYQTNPLGETIEYTYNALGLPASVTTAEGNRFEVRYDSFGNILALIDPLDHRVTQVIGLNGLPGTRLFADGAAMTMRYDEFGQMISQVNQVGVQANFTYNDAGEKTSHSQNRAINGEQVTETTAYDYDAIDRVIAITDALGNRSTMTYDEVGNMVTKTDALGRTTEYTFDVYRRLTRTDFADGSFTSASYDPEGNQISTTDQLGRTTDFVFDDLNRLIESRYANGSVEFNEYNAVSELVATTDANGNRTTYVYDDASRLIRETNALGHSTQYEYDQDGRQIAMIDGLNRRTEYVYDAMDRLIQTIRADGATETNVYDELGRLIVKTDATNRSVTMEYDDLGRLTTVEDPLNHRWTMAYDEANHRIQLTDPLNRSTKWTFDALGRELTHQLPLGQIQSQSYNAVGNQITHRDFNGQRHSMQYDVLNRLIRAEYQDGRVITRDYLANGLPERVVAPEGTWQYDYDLVDRLQRITTPIGALTYDYDANGNRTLIDALHHGERYEQSFEFDAINRLIRMTDQRQGISEFDYNEVNDITRVTAPNGIQTRYNYDQKHNITQVLQQNSAGDLLTQFDYALDAQGRRETIAQTFGGGLTGDLTPWNLRTRVTDNSYDQAARLVAENIADSLLGANDNSYSYDTVNNMIESQVQGVTTAYRYDDNDRLLQKGGQRFQYDSVGNLIQESLDGAITSYSYNSQQQLVSVLNGQGQTQMSYDPNGLLFAQMGPVAANDYLWDSNRQYAQIISEGQGSALSRIYSHAPGLIIEDAVNDIFYNHQDAKGSTSLVSNATGILNAHVYSAYGDLIDSAAVNESQYLYGGEYFNKANNAYNLRKRWYRPELGRFTQMDTWPGNAQNPISYNKYLYGNADPVNHLDPTGMFGLAEFSAAEAIRAQITGIQIDIGTSFLDAHISGDAQEMATNASVMVGLGVLGGAGFKILKKLSSKARKILGNKKALSGGDLNSARSLIKVTKSQVEKVLGLSTLRTQQKSVSLEKIEGLVLHFKSGGVVPAIKLDGNIIVDGHHRYIASKIVGNIKLDINPGRRALSDEIAPTFPLSDLKVY